MTKELLEDYPHICQRILALEQKGNAVVADTVSGSLPNPPYIQHSIGIKGVMRLTPAEEASLSRLRAKKEAIEEWRDSLQTEREKLVVELHAFKRLEWSRIFKKTGHFSPDAARMFYERTVKKYL